MPEIFEKGSWLRDVVDRAFRGDLDEQDRKALPVAIRSIELIERACVELRNRNRALALELLEEGLRKPDPGIFEDGQARAGTIEERYQAWLASRPGAAA